MSLSPRLALACALLTSACAGRRAPAPLIQAALRSELDHHTCARWEPSVKQWSLLLFDPDCEPAPPSGDPAKLVHAAVARLRPLVFLSTAVYDRFYDAPGAAALPPATAQRRADAVVWSDPDLTAAIWRALAVELGARGLACSDCPPGPAPAPFTIAWADLFPYLAAYVWPAQASPDAPVQIFTCSGIHGAAALPEAPALTQAGKLVALAFADDPAHGREIHDLAGAGSLADVTRAVRDYLDSPPSRRFACAALADVAWYTGLRITDCDAAG